MRRLVRPLVALTLAAGAAFVPVANRATAQAALTDRQYCDLLIETYNRYLGQSVARSQFPDVAAGAAIADCEKGNTASGIPVLERKLRNAGFTLPARRAP